MKKTSAKYRQNSLNTRPASRASPAKASPALDAETATATAIARETGIGIGTATGTETEICVLTVSLPVTLWAYQARHPAQTQEMVSVSAARLVFRVLLLQVLHLKASWVVFLTRHPLDSG